MKKVLIGLAVIASGIVMAGDQISPVVGNRQDRVIDELQINMNKLANSNGVMVVSKVTAVTNAVTTLAVSGVATLTGIPAINSALTPAGTNVLLTSTGPTDVLAAPKWIPITHNGTNMWIAAWAK